MVQNRETNPTRHRLLLWIFIVIYVALLPHLIIILKFILGFLSFSVVRALPIVALLLAAVAYLGMCRIKRSGYGITTFIIPTLLLLVGVYFLESNPIKYTHIPLYAVLVCLIYGALRRSNIILPIVIASACYASMLGVFDEIHHGVHPERYIGWKDMVINSVGATIGALLFVTTENKGTNDPAFFMSDAVRSKIFIAQVIVVLLNGVVSVISVFTLFAVTKAGFKAAYPGVLVAFNAAAIISCVVMAVCNWPRLKTRIESELLLFFPSVIFMSIQVLILLAYGFDIEFK